MSLSTNALAAVAKGKTAQFVADAYGLSRREVVREAQAAGYRHDPTSDTFLATPAVVRPTVSDLPTGFIAAEQPPAEPDLLDVARGMAPHSKRVARALTKAEQALVDLSAAVTDEAAKAELRAKEQRLADELARVRAELKGDDRAMPAVDWTVDRLTASAKEIRAWAAANGIDCPARGKVPASVRQAFDEAAA